SNEVTVNTRCLLELFQYCSLCQIESCITIEGHERQFSITQDCQSCGHHREWRSHPTPADLPVEAFNIQDPEEVKQEEHTKHEDVLGKEQEDEDAYPTVESTPEAGDRDANEVEVQIASSDEDSTEPNCEQNDELYSSSTEEEPSEVDEVEKKGIRKKQNSSDEWEPHLEEVAADSDVSMDDSILIEDGQGKLVMWCTVCKTDATLSCSLYRHKKVFACAQCGAGNNMETHSSEKLVVHFEDFPSFQEHAEKEHGAKPFQTFCQECGKLILADPKSSGCEDHICEHKTKSIVCPKCGKRFLTEVGLKGHCSRLHQEADHPCKYCLKLFTNRPSKLEHEQTHPKEKQPYSCPDCPETFDNINKRNSHLKLHRGPYKYACDSCGRRFRDIIMLKRHKLIHSGGKPFRCQVCDLSFNQLSNLSSHMRLHAGERPFMCEQCGESFNHHVSLKNHLMRYHCVGLSQTEAQGLKFDSCQWKRSQVLIVLRLSVQAEVDASTPVEKLKGKVICEEHFQPCDYYEKMELATRTMRRFLRDTAVPSLGFVKSPERSAVRYVVLGVLPKDSYWSNEVLVNMQCLLELFQYCSLCQIESCINIEGHEKQFSITQSCQRCGQRREWRSHPTPAGEYKAPEGAASCPEVEHTLEPGDEDSKEVVVQIVSLDHKGTEQNSEQTFIENDGSYLSSTEDESSKEEEEEKKKKGKRKSKKEDSSDEWEPHLDEEAADSNISMDDSTSIEDGQGKLVMWCTACKTDATLSCSLHRHKKVFACAQCGAGNNMETHSSDKLVVHFEDFPSFQEHAEKEHGAKPFQKLCQECGKLILADPKSSGCEDHICEHKAKPIVCPECGKRFHTEVGLKRHFSKLHKEADHPCKYCLKLFTNRPSKLEHEQTHPKEKQPYSCPDCPERFNNIHKRNSHLKLHRGPYKYACDSCGKRFRDIIKLNRHKLIHSGEKPFRCQVCDRSFNQIGNLSSHMRLHTGEKPFMCEQCGECFNHNVSLKNHLMRYHHAVLKAYPEVLSTCWLLFLAVQLIPSYRNRGGRRPGHLMLNSITLLHGQTAVTQPDTVYQSLEFLRFTRAAHRSGSEAKRTTKRFHRFPKDLNICRLWLTNIKHRLATENINRDSVKNLRVCSDHFLPEDYRERSLNNSLNASAVPSVFSWTRPPRRGDTEHGVLVSMVDIAVLLVLIDYYSISSKHATTGLHSYGSNEVLVNTRCLLELFQYCALCQIESCITIEGHERQFSITQDCQSCGHHRQWRSHPTPADEPVEALNTQHKDPDQVIRGGQEDEDTASYPETERSPEPGDEDAEEVVIQIVSSDNEGPEQNREQVLVGKSRSYYLRTEEKTGKRRSLRQDRLDEVAADSELSKDEGVFVVEVAEQTNMEDSKKQDSTDKVDTESDDSMDEGLLIEEETEDKNTGKKDSREQERVDETAADSEISKDEGFFMHMERRSTRNRKCKRQGNLEEVAVDSDGSLDEDLFSAEEEEKKVSRKRKSKRQDSSDEWEPRLVEVAVDSDLSMDEDLFSALTEDGRDKLVVWCVACKADATLPCSLRHHKKVFACAQCGAGDNVETHSFENLPVHFRNFASFQKHAEKEHGAKPLHKVCQECGKLVLSEPESSGRKEHKCEKAKSIVCPECGKRFHTEIGLKRHFSKLHKDADHPCKYCLKLFTNRPSKLEHEQTHPKETQPYSCPDCPERFDNIHKRNSHLKLHRGPYKYACDSCGKRFRDIIMLKRHKLIHSGEKPFRCQVCDRSFNQIGNLSSHMRLHTGEKPFMCEQCGECFNHNVSLKNHLMRYHHAGDTKVPS
ncbi:hypothetical protein NFI96_010915, partial [Prochilodus magdalenae]